MGFDHDRVPVLPFFCETPTFPRFLDWKERCSRYSFDISDHTKKEGIRGLPLNITISFLGPKLPCVRTRDRTR